MQGTVLCAEMTRYLFFFFFQGIYSLGGDSRQNGKYTSAVKLRHTRLGHEVEGGLSHCKA